MTANQLLGFAVYFIALGDLTLAQAYTTAAQHWLGDHPGDSWDTEVYKEVLDELANWSNDEFYVPGICLGCFHPHYHHLHIRGDRPVLPLRPSFCEACKGQVPSENISWPEVLEDITKIMEEES